MYEIKKVSTSEFFPLYKTYFAMKYSQYYFRQSVDTVVEKLEYVDSNYILLQGGHIIGGALMKENYLSDVFVVAPYVDYQVVLDQFIKYLKVISHDDKKTLVYEVIEEHLKYYEKYEMTYGNIGHWMIRPTELIHHHLDSNYSSRTIKNDDVQVLAKLIYKTYQNNPAFKVMPSQDNLQVMLEGFIGKNVDNANYKNSLVIVDNMTGDLVGVSTHMIFEGLPLVTEIAVDPAHQGKGLGTYLLHHAINGYHQDFDGIRLYVFKANKALGLYQHLGFINNKTINDVFITLK